MGIVTAEISFWCDEVRLPTSMDCYRTYVVNLTGIEDHRKLLKEAAKMLIQAKGHENADKAKIEIKHEHDHLAVLYTGYWVGDDREPDEDNEDDWLFVDGVQFSDNSEW